MARPDASVLQALFEREPAEALAYLKSKGLRITWNWAEMLDEAHARAFTVAKAARLDVLADIRHAVIAAAAQGKTLTQFGDELTPLLQQKGWWGRQVIVDGEGRAEMVQLGSPHRLRTIYQTNLQSAYMAGRAQAQAAADAFPYLQYVAIRDAKTRPGHAALDGQVFAKDDPIWQVIGPPNGFNCRCRTRALTAGQLEREGLAVQSSDDRIVSRTVDAGVDQRTGELFPAVQQGIRVRGRDGKDTVMWVDPGFNASPLAGHWMDTLLAKKAVAALGDEAGFATVARAVAAPTRMKAWAAFIDNTFGFGRIQGQTMTAGMLPLPVARTMAERGTPFVPVLHVEDRLLVGPKARRHASRGDALSREEWASLPSHMPAAAWYRDTQAGDLVAELAGGVYVMVSPSGAVDSAYRDAAAASKIRQGRWVPVK